MSDFFALVDVNNMYVSCERVFRPDWEHRPMVVLSNNDGCVISRSAEVKLMGIAMGTPWFKIRTLAKQQHILALSSNYALYGDMSQRFMSILAQYNAVQEIYSIDECFLGLVNLQPEQRIHHGHHMRNTIRQWIGLPVCIGIGKTKTRAKLANYLAKKQMIWQGVCDLESVPDVQVTPLMQSLSVGNVWGIGPRLTQRLEALGYQTVNDLCNAEPKQVRRMFGVSVERTVLELRGHACFNIQETPQDKKEITSSRSFGHPVVTVEHLAESIGAHVARACEKLRRQSSRTAAIHVFIMTNRFKTQGPQYYNGVTITLSYPSDDNRVILQAALRGLHNIYRSGFEYAKAGIHLLGLSPVSMGNNPLWECDRQESPTLMNAMDHINHRFGHGSVGLGVAGLRSPRPWGMKRENKTPNYTSAWEELRTVNNVYPAKKIN